RDATLAELVELTGTYRAGLPADGEARATAEAVEAAARELQKLYATLDEVGGAAAQEGGTDRMEVGGEEGGTAVAPLVQWQEAQAQARLAAMHGTVQQSTVWVSVVAAVGAVLAVLGGVVIARGVTRNARRVMAAARALEEGDLTRRVGLASRDEFGAMGRALDEGVARLRSLVADVATIAASVAGAAEELLAGGTRVREVVAASSEQSSAVAAGAEQVSASVQTVAVGAEQMGAAIREIAQSSEEAARIASRAAEVAVGTT